MLDEGNLDSLDTVLWDGRRVSDLIDRDRREVAQRVLNDPEIYQLELKNIFAKAWIIAGHESEVPNPGDFITRQIGEDSVILVRSRDGDIECLLNACTHRGATVCRTDAGNASVFRCIYHGWIFNLDGSFRGMPFQNEMYPNGCDTEALGLRRARVSVFAGIIFVNWDETAPSLVDYLGDFGWYVNSIFNRTNCGYEVLGPPQRFVMNANWKTAAEQFAGDGYHAGQLHRSLTDLVELDPNNPRHWSLYDPKVSTNHGHSAICFSLAERLRRISKEGAENWTPSERLTALPPPGMTPDQVPGMLERFTAEELNMLSMNPAANCGLFPNAGIWSNAAMLPDGSPSSFLSLRTFVPLGPDRFEFMMWQFVAKDAPHEFRQELRLTSSLTQGAMGTIESDDAEVWPGMTKPARGYIGRQNSLRYWSSAGNNPPPGWIGGGDVHTGFSMDDNQWAWWSRYFDYLTGKA